MITKIITCVVAIAMFITVVCYAIKLIREINDLEE